VEKLIITCAPTGSLTVPTQSPYLPITPEQIVDEAVRAANAGAAMVHIHARDPEDGRPTSDLEIMGKIFTGIRERSNVIIGLTTGGGPGMTPEERIKVVPEFRPEIASFNMGPVILSTKGLLEKFTDEEYKYSWEKAYLEKIEEAVMLNTFASLDVFLRTMDENGTKSECEVWDASHVFNVAYLHGKGKLRSPVWMQFVTGAIGGIGSAPEDIIYLKHTADRSLGAENYEWSVIGIGRAEFPAAVLAIIMGGHVRVGFEDNLWLQKGHLAKSNAQLVEKVVRIAEELGREIATPDEARNILGLTALEKANR
jgi:uncharacterized protein (DUF849 family)